MPEIEVNELHALVSRICKNHRVLSEVVTMKHRVIDRQKLLGTPSNVLKRIEDEQIKHLRKHNREPAA